MDYLHHYNSPLGGITMACDDEALVGLWFDGQKFFADCIDSTATEKNCDIFMQTDKWLDTYFAGMAPDFMPPIKMRTTNFRQKVNEIMLDIPFGQTMTYGEIAAIIADFAGGQKMSAQAVGNAVGHNSISLIIPCHRVIGAKGKLTGYAGGLDRKIKLLQLEKII